MSTYDYADWQDDDVVPHRGPLSPATVAPPPASGDVLGAARAAAVRRSEEDRLLRDLPGLEAQQERERRRTERQRTKERALAEASRHRALKHERQAALPEKARAVYDAIAAYLAAADPVLAAEQAETQALLLADEQDWRAEHEQATATLMGRGYSEADAQRQAWSQTTPRPDNQQAQAWRLLRQHDPGFGLLNGLPDDGKGWAKLREILSGLVQHL